MDFKEAYGFRWETEEPWNEEVPACHVLVRLGEGLLDEEAKQVAGADHCFALYPQGVFWSIFDPASHPRPLRVQMDADSLCIYGAELRRYIEGGGLSDQAMDAMALRDGQDAGHSQEEATAKSSKRSEPRLTANELGQMELLKVIEVIKVLHMELKGEPFDPLKARGKKRKCAATDWRDWSSAGLYETSPLKGGDHESTNQGHSKVY